MGEAVGSVGAAVVGEYVMGDTVGVNTLSSDACVADCVGLKVVARAAEGEKVGEAV